MARGFGLNELARRVGISASHLSRVERGEKGVSIPTLYRLAHELELKELMRLLRPYIEEEVGS